MPQSEPPSFHVRFPPSLLKRIRIAAAENGQSVNSEIVARLEGSFVMSDRDRKILRSLLSDAISVLDKGSGKSS